MFSLYDQYRRAVGGIIQHELETGEQMKSHFSFQKHPSEEEQKLWWESLPKGQRDEILAQLKEGCMYFHDVSFIRPDCEIGVFMDYQKYKPQREKETKSAPMHYHNYFEMFYVYRGHCFSVIDGVEREFKAGELCLYSLQAKHYCYLPSEEDIVFNFIIRESAIDDTMVQMLSDSDVFAGFFIDSLCNKSQRTSMSFRIQEQSELSFYLLKMIATYYQAISSCNSLMRSLLLCLFYGLTQQFKLQSDAESQRESRGISISAVIEYIEENYRTITLQDAANHFFYDAHSLSRFIQKYTGKKFSKVVQEIKLKKACQLLRNPEIPLDSIPSIIGYSDRHYLDKLFRQSFGISMLKYRRKYHM